MIKYIEKSRAEGEICAPPSKSIAHRLLIAASICKGQKSIIHNIPECEDVMATIDCLRALGVKIEYENGTAIIEGVYMPASSRPGELNCRESGSTLRFLIPLALLSGSTFSFIGSERLLSRPIDVYEKIAAEKGFVINKNGNALDVCGILSPGEYHINGNVSSQFITGMLFALSTLESDSKIIMTSEIESRSYIDLTVSAMAEFGFKAEWTDGNTLSVYANPTPTGRELTIEGDWSGAAFPLALCHLGGDVRVCGLNQNSIQGDRVCRDLFSKLDEGFCIINVEDCPDLAPVLFTVAATKEGAEFVGTKRLKIKESDRALAMQTELSKFGARITVEENRVIVHKSMLHKPTERLCSHNDHRIVMSLAILCSIYGGEIEGCEAVAKSYPDFFSDIEKLGILSYEIN